MRPKSFGVADDAAAEMILPDAIHHHARGQRIFGIDDPLGQFGARTSVVSGSSGSCLQKYA